MGTTKVGNQILTSPNGPGGPVTMHSGLTIGNDSDSIGRNHYSFTEAFELPENDDSIDKGAVVGPASETDTSPTLDATNLKSILPQSIAEPNASRLATGLPNSTTNLHRQVLFSLANNLAGLDGADMSKVAKFLQNETHQGLLGLICSSPSYSARAIAQNIFRGAIELGDAKLIDLLLNEKSSGIDVNRLWCCIEVRKYTPIERGSFLGHEEVIEVLLKHGADVTRTDPSRGKPYGALECAFGDVHRDQHIFNKAGYRIGRRLLNAGGDLSESYLKSLMNPNYQDGEFVGLFISANAYKKVALWSEQGIFRDAVRFLDDRTAMAVVRIMLDIRADLNYQVKETDFHHIEPRSVMDAAARRGNVEMVKTLLTSGALLTDDTLILAITSGNSVLLRLLLDTGANVNSYHVHRDRFDTPLAEAIRLQDAETIDLLEGYGPVRLEDEKQFSAAIIAASEVGDIPFIERLIQLEDSVHAKGLGRALAVTIYYGHVEIAKMLLDAGATVNECIFDCGPPLLGAVRSCDAALVHLLLEAEADPNQYRYGYDDEDPMSEAIEWGDRSIVETLLLAGADIRNQHFVQAVIQQDYGLVQLLLDGGADVNGINVDTDNTAVQEALEIGNINMACYLLDRGADPLDTERLGKAMVESSKFFDLVLEKHRTRYPLKKAGFGCNALTWAVEQGDERAIRTMLERGLDANSQASSRDDGYRKERTPFGHAIANSTLDVIELFLQKGCTPNSIVAESPYHHAVSYRLTGFLAAVDTRNVSKVKLLHRYGADVNFPAHTRVKHTPLQRASAIGYIDIVELLINLGAEVNAPPARSGGGTALQLAAIGGFIPLACLLLNSKADVNAPSSKLDGRMALEGAAEHGRLDMVQLLLNAGAGRKGTDQRQFDRAKALAKEQGHDHIVDLLEDHLQQRLQEEEPVILPDRIDTDFAMWDPSQEMDGIGTATLDGWM